MTITHHNGMYAVSLKNHPVTIINKDRKAAMLAASKLLTGEPQ